jgi:hypothetical protein
VGIHNAFQLSANCLENQRVAVAERADRRTAGGIEKTSAAVVKDRAALGRRDVPRFQTRVTVENVQSLRIQVVAPPWKA